MTQTQEPSVSRGDTPFVPIDKVVSLCMPSVRSFQEKDMRTELLSLVYHLASSKVGMNGGNAFTPDLLAS